MNGLETAAPLARIGSCSILVLAAGGSPGKRTVRGIRRDRQLYIIRNARLDPQWARVDRRILPIALRAISSLIRYQGIRDLYRI
jgi:hypothetical protein